MFKFDKNVSCIGCPIALAFILRADGYTLEKCGFSHLFVLTSGGEHEKLTVMGLVTVKNDNPVTEVPIMKEEWTRCRQDSSHFCPVAFHRNSRLFWNLFALSVVAAVALNAIYESSLLLMLYAYPVVLMSMLRIPLSGFAALGVVTVGSLFLLEPFSGTLIAVAAAYAVLMAIVKRIVWISENHYNERTAQADALMTTVLSLAKTIDARDRYTAFHSNNVAEYARSIAREMGLPQMETDAVYLAGLVHDIGKIGTPDAILQKEGRLTEEEYAIMKRHAEDGYQIIKDMPRLRDLGITDMVRHHHERPDGKGYPHGLKGREVPIGARILGVADAFDAMTTNRAYRQKLAVSTAARELEKHSGTQFDPVAAQALLAVLVREGRLEAEPAHAGAAAAVRIAT